MSGRVDPVGVRERLILLRMAFNYATQAEMAEAIGHNFQAYHKAERLGELGRDMAFDICASLPGVTLDYLYFGNEDYLPPILVRQLHGLPKPAKRLSTGGVRRRRL